MLACTCGCAACGDVIMEDAKHFRKALVPEVDVAGVHLVEDELIAVVAVAHAQLRLNLVKVDRHVLRLLADLLLLEGVQSLLLGILNAALARLALRCLPDWRSILASG